MRKLARAKYDRKLLGVCGGIAHTYGWDPTLTRIGTVILAIAIPGPSLFATLLAYVLLAAVMPESNAF